MPATYTITVDDRRRNGACRVTVVPAPRRSRPRPEALALVARGVGRRASSGGSTRPLVADAERARSRAPSTIRRSPSDALAVVGRRRSPGSFAPSGRCGAAGGWRDRHLSRLPARRPAHVAEHDRAATRAIWRRSTAFAEREEARGRGARSARSRGVRAAPDDRRPGAALGRARRRLRARLLPVPAASKSASRATPPRTCAPPRAWPALPKYLDLAQVDRLLAQPDPVDAARAARQGAHRAAVRDRPARDGAAVAEAGRRQPRRGLPDLHRQRGQAADRAARPRRRRLGAALPRRRRGRRCSRGARRRGCSSTQRRAAGCRASASGRC